MRARPSVDRSNRAAETGPEDAARPFPWRAPTLFVAAVALLVFARALGNGFTGWDDTIYTTENPNARDLRGLWRIWSSIDNEQYYPLTFSVHWLEVRLFGQRAAGYHAVSLLLHAVNSVLVLSLLRALRFARLPAVLAALWFAVHPTNAMTVAWVAERKNLLACLFALSATLAWIRWRERGVFSAWLAALLLFGCALLSKTQILAVPLAWLALDRLRFGRPLARSVLAVLPFLALSAGAGFVTRIFEQRYLDPHTLASLPPLVERLQIAAAALWWYGAQALFPLELAPFHPLWDVSPSSILWWLPVAALALIATVLVVRLPSIARHAASGDGRAAFGIAHFALALAPILGLAAYANLPSTYVSDHYLYLALPGAAVCLALFLAVLTRTGRGRRVTTAAVACVLAVESALAFEYVSAFADARSLWSRTIEASPESYVAHLGLAESLAADGDLEAALPHYRRACEIEPRWIDAWQRLGAALVRAGRLAGAEPPLREALARSPGNVPALCDLGHVLEREGRLAEALAAFESAVRGAPKDLRARLELGTMYLGFARHADAEAQFAALVHEHGEFARGWLGLATALRGQGRMREAIESLRAGLERVPHDLDLENLLALSLASAREDGLRDGAEALSLARSACERTGHRDHQLVSTLAVACAETGRFEEALAWSAKARELALAAGRARDAEEEERRSELYRRGEAYRR